MDIPKLIAHRGAKSLAPENTMEAYALAVKNKINWIELDVQLSTDGEIFIFHDDDMERLTGLKGQVTNLSLAEIKSLDVGSWFDIKFKGTKVPTLEQYLLWMRKNPQVFTNIEIKCKPEEDVLYEITLARQVILLLDKYADLFSRIMVSSFSMNSLKEVRKHSKDIRLAMAVCIKDWKLEREAFIRNNVSTYLELGCITLVINDDQISQKRLNLIKRYCDHVLCFSLTEFSYERAYELFRWGANSLFVDDVKILDNRKVPTRPRVGLLATGSELTHGDVLNTNSPNIASVLFESGIAVGTHVICNDTQYEVHQNLEALLSEHDVVITIGGLGPTEDDLTRYAVADVVTKPLEFNQASWDRIVDILAPRYGRDNIPENNISQANFPQDSIIYPNETGTADGCYVNFVNRYSQQKHLFMLPGPPKECMAMFKSEAIGDIKKILEPIELINYKWLLMGVSESGIAMDLNSVVERYGEVFSYRSNYPYIEVKYHTEVLKKKKKQVVRAIESCIKPYLVSSNGLSASDNLIGSLCTGYIMLEIKDNATNNILSGYIVSPEVLIKMKVGKIRYKLEITINGLIKYWLSVQDVNDALSLNMVLTDIESGKQYKRKVATQVYIKNRSAIEYACEWLSWQMNNLISKRCNLDEK